MIWIVAIVSVFLVSVLLTGIIIPQILLIAFRKKLFDDVDERKIHKGAVPRLGGIAFMPAIVLSMSLVCGVALLTFNSYSPALFNSMEVVLTSNGEMSLLLPICFGLCAIMLMYLIGIADDLIGLQYRAKFVAQILAGLLLAAGGLKIESLDGMFGIWILPEGISWLLTVFLTVFITNAINLIDGIDGLASGLSGIAMIYYGMFFIAGSQWGCAMIAFASLGTLVPFFYYNVFGSAFNRKKIFMGDTGSLTTGLVLSFLAFRLCDMNVNFNIDADILVLAFSPLAVPCLDVVRVFIHRIIRGHSLFLPDRVHIHHKLLALGMPSRAAMISIVSFSALLTAMNIAISPVMSVLAIVFIDLAIWVVVNLALTKNIRRLQVKKGITNGYD